MELLSHQSSVFVFPSSSIIKLLQHPSSPASSASVFPSIISILLIISLVLYAHTYMYKYMLFSYLSTVYKVKFVITRKEFYLSRSVMKFSVLFEILKLFISKTKDHPHYICMFIFCFLLFGFDCTWFWICDVSKPRKYTSIFFWYLFKWYRVMQAFTLGKHWSINFHCKTFQVLTFSYV